MDGERRRCDDLLILGDGPGARVLLRAALAAGLRADWLAPSAAGPERPPGGVSPFAAADWPWPFASDPADTTDPAGPPAPAARVRLGGDGLVLLGETAGTAVLRPRCLALAPRARPRRPAWWRGPLAMTAPPAARDARVPLRVLVLGGGHTGVEAAAAWAAAGADTRLVEVADRLLPAWAPALAARAAADLAARGVQVHLGCRVVACEVGPTAARARWRPREGGPAREATADVVVPALGWRPELAGLGLDRTHARCDRHGHVQTDGRLATAEPGLFALGAALAVPVTRGTAVRQAAVVAAAVTGAPVPPLRHGLAARVVRGPGPLLQAGLTVAAARERGHVAAVARAGDHAAWAACVRDRDTGDLLGVQAVGPGAPALAAAVDQLLAGAPSAAAPSTAPSTAPKGALGLLAAALAASPAAVGEESDG